MYIIECNDCNEVYNQINQLLSQENNEPRKTGQGIEYVSFSVGKLMQILKAEKDKRFDQTFNSGATCWTYLFAFLLIKNVLAEIYMVFTEDVWLRPFWGSELIRGENYTFRRPFYQMRLPLLFLSLEWVFKGNSFLSRFLSLRARPLTEFYKLFTVNNILTYLHRSLDKFAYHLFLMIPQQTLR